MGVCCSKRRESSYPDIVPSYDPIEERSTVKEENETSEAAEFLKGATSLTTKKASCVVEGEDKKVGETPVKQSAHLKEEKGSKAAATITTPLRTSSCTKEEVDAILIQCGHLSRNSSGKASNEMVGQRRPSGSKKSYDFDNDVKEEAEAFYKCTSRPSARLRTRSGSREGGSNEGRRVSRSPGRRSDGPASSTGDKARQQPTKMISVPATEKGALFVNGDTDGGSSDGKRVSVPQSTRSRSPVNNARKSNENAQSQSVSRCSSRKADEFILNPMAETDKNSLINHNEANVSMLQSSREVGDKTIQSQLIHAKKAEIVEEAGDAKFDSGVENLNPLAITITRSSRRTSCDLDNNSVLKPTSYDSFMLEDIQNHQQNTTALSFPTCVSKSSCCSEQRSYDTDQSNNNSFLKSEFARRASMVQRETSKESELEVKNVLKKPSIHKHVTARDAVLQESAGSNSFIGESWDSSWDLNSVDSTDRRCTLLPCNALEVEVEDEVGQKGNRQQKRSWEEPVGGQRSRGSSHGNDAKATITAATPLVKKFDHCKLHQSGHVVGFGNGKGDGRAISVRLSVTTS